MLADFCRNGRLIRSPETVDEQIDEFGDVVVIEIAQRGVLGQLDHADPRIAEQDAEQRSRFRQAQPVVVWEIGGGHLAFRQDVDVEVQHHRRGRWDRETERDVES
jgi:hypothetical protein